MALAVSEKEMKPGTSASITGHSNKRPAKNAGMNKKKFLIHCWALINHRYFKIAEIQILNYEIPLVHLLFLYKKSKKKYN